ncbi:MAG TPA: hypothetical protein VFQ25_13620 [Ktedonobacterales bacterium]|nr:hypothetical protein [Ktedonobacterales bacterium]
MAAPQPHQRIIRPSIRPRLGHVGAAARRALRRRAVAPRRLVELAVTALLAMALSACAWAPASWLSSHIPPIPEQLKSIARAPFGSSPFSAPAGPSKSAREAPSVEFPSVPGAPASYQLTTAGNLQAAEPGAGGKANYPLAGASDDAGSAYWDPYYATLCGPGAVSVALYYWPAALRHGASVSVADPLLAWAPATSWSDQDVDGVYRGRGSMMRLAFQVRPPGWSQGGMLPQSYAQSGQKGGATLQVTRDALNWEASGENLRAWEGYFYTTQWNSAYYNQRQYPNNLYQALHADIVTDLAFHHVPVIVEITAAYLPNWRDTNPVNHFVAITGYDDTTGTYTYLDTCKVYTGCNGGGVDAPGLRTIDQLQLAQGVANIATNETSGDGGWVW